MITFDVRGDFKNSFRFLTRVRKLDISSSLRALGMRGVQALAAHTPIDSGLTAASWGFDTEVSSRSSSITWTNSHQNKGVPIAIILQYGHGTGTGGYVSGRDYINPAIQPIFDEIADDVWKVVTSA